MPGEKIPLRSSIFPMGRLVAIGDDKTIEGPFGPYFQEYHNYYSEFNRSYVWVTDGTLTGSRMPNGTLTGVLQHMWNNLSDVCLMPNPRSPDTDVVEFGFYMTTSPVIVISPLDVHKYEDKILKQLFRFSIDIVFLLMITMYVFARVLRKSEIRHDSVQGVLDGVWHMIQMMLNQVHVSPVTHAGRILVVLTVTGVFFWLQIWQNQMKMEMIAFDTSSVIRNLDEAVAANQTLLMTKTEAASLEVIQKAIDYPDTSLGKLYKTARFNSKASSNFLTGGGLRGLTHEIVSRFVVVMSASLLGYMEGSLCMLLRSISDFNFLLGDEVVVDIPTGPWTNPHLNPVHKEILRRKSLKIVTHGLEKYFSELMDKETVSITKLIFPGPDTHCVYRSVDEFVNLKLTYGNPAMTVAQLSDVFELLCYATCGALLVLSLEAAGFMEAAASKYRVMQRHVKRRRRETRRNFWKLQVEPGPSPVTNRVDQSANNSTHVWASPNTL